MGKGARNRARRQAAATARGAMVRDRRTVNLWPGLVDGVTLSTQTRVRLARPEDEPALRRYIMEATEDPEVADPAKTIPIACPSITAGMREGKDGFITGLAQEWTQVGTGTGDGRIVAGFSLVAVDDDDDDDVLGSVTVCPPYSFLSNILDGFPLEEQRKLVLQAQLGISKIVAVAVREDLRGEGIGADLVSTALQVIRRCNLGMITFGSCEPSRAAFYRRLGFAIASVAQPIDLYMALGIHAMVSTPDHHIFSMRQEPR